MELGYFGLLSHHCLSLTIHKHSMQHGRTGAPCHKNSRREMKDSDYAVRGSKFEQFTVDVQVVFWHEAQTRLRSILPWDTAPLCLYNSHSGFGML